MEHVDPAVLRRVPLELVVPPVLLHPQVGRHDLVLQVLKLSKVRHQSITAAMDVSDHSRVLFVFLVKLLLQTSTLADLLTTAMSWESFSLSLTVTTSETFETGLTSLL